MIKVLTPERPEKEGPSLADLLTRLVSQRSAMTGLMRQMLEIVTRLDPAARRIAGDSSTEGAGRT